MLTNRNVVPWTSTRPGTLPQSAYGVLYSTLSRAATIVPVTVAGATFRLQVEEAGHRFGRRRGAPCGTGQRLGAPMPGRVVAVHVRAGDRVEPNVAVAPGQAVNAGDLLVVVAPDGA